MKTTLYELLKQNGHVVQDEHKDIILEKCLWTPSEEKLELKFSKEVNKAFLDDFYHLLKQQFPSLDVKFSYGENKNTTWDESYLSTLIQRIENKFPGCENFLETPKFNPESKNISFGVTSAFIYEQLKADTLKNTVEEWIAQDCNKNIHISFYLKEDHSKDFLHFSQKEEQQRAEKLTEKFKTVQDRKERSEKIDTLSKKSRYKKKDYENLNPTPIANLHSDITDCVVEGKIVKIDSRDLSSSASGLDKTVVTINLFDGTGTVSCKSFIKNSYIEAFLEEMIIDNYYRVAGKYAYDDFDRSYQIKIASIDPIETKIILDHSPVKRTELHLHTKMSTMDGLVDVNRLMKRLKTWGHDAVAITDIDGVQCFPEAASAAQKHGIKPIFGMDTLMVQDKDMIFVNAEKDKSYAKYVVFDIETTGLSNQYDRITEIGAVKIENGQMNEVFSQLINPEKNIPRKIESLTGITNEMVKTKPTIDQVLPEFIDFCEDAVLVAHNAQFDIGFIFKNAEALNLKFNNPYIDTLALARVLLTDLKRHRLDVLTKYFKINLENHHRAEDDAIATAQVFIRLLQRSGLKPPYETTCYLNNIGEKHNLIKFQGERITILALNQKGIHNLYKIVTESHLNNYYSRARIQKSFLGKNREGLLIGTGAPDSEFFNAMLSGYNQNKLLNILSFYDYVEVLPPVALYWMVEQEMIENLDQIKRLLSRMIQLAIKAGKPVIATGDVFYLDKEDAFIREILYKGGKPRRYNDKSAALYLRTTEDMLEQFNFLDKTLAYKIVVENPKKIADRVSTVNIILPGTYTPEIKGSDELLRKMTFKNAKSIYGSPLPEIVEQRLLKELNSIISNGYSVLYVIAQKLVTKSVEDGYLVGSRGSVGSSFVATMADITEVNPLPPHYICPSCQYSEFISDGSYESGVDLPDKDCPKCGHALAKDGHEIPFEVFLGFEGDKEPDIDLNFAGEYQANAHKYTEEIFGKENVIRAGTIGTISSKTAYGYIQNYCEKEGKSFSKAEIDRIQEVLNGVKRTTGQHPGGIMIFPKDRQIYEFSPLQYPADDINSGVITTHFSYKALSGHILKLDILGHDVPSIIRMLSDLTGVDPLHIPLGDPETMAIFNGDLNNTISTLGIPEFGTDFVQKMLQDTNPTTFAELVRISGLSHGTDVWIDNAQSLIEDGTTNLKGVIATRDDIMTYLIHKGLDKKEAFSIMESVRKGRGLKPENEEDMIEHGVPDWYIDSCYKIQYMFPKAHAVAYVLMSYRIAYFKVHYPLAFYATYFSTKMNDFSSAILGGKVRVYERMMEIESNEERTQKEEAEYQVLEVAKEMYDRNIEMLPVSLEYSEANAIKISEDGKLIPPLRALDSISDSIAISIYEEYQKADFLSVQDLIERTKANKNAVESLKDAGVINDLNETNQLSFF